MSVLAFGGVRPLICAWACKILRKLVMRQNPEEEILAGHIIMWMEWAIIRVIILTPPCPCGCAGIWWRLPTRMYLLLLKLAVKKTWNCRTVEDNIGGEIYGMIWVKIKGLDTRLPLMTSTSVELCSDCVLKLVLLMSIQTSVKDLVENWVSKPTRVSKVQFLAVTIW